MSRLRPNEDSWNLSDERQFIENLFNQRLNFYLVVYSLVIAGAFNAVDPHDRALVLAIGIFLCAILALSMYRACHKLLLILKLLHRTNGHPVRLSGKLARKVPWPLSVSVNHITGIWFPLSTILILCALLLRTTLGT
ncbi:MAG: hypothetical protein JRC53_01370 [Deltaproteobacteria bacterium]|nr:hypothetical protein [Deltaproteobacteria bacterium]